MKSRSIGFNFYFCFLILLMACKTTEQKKAGREASTVRLHLEANRDGTDRNMSVPVYRASPKIVSIERRPFLTEIDLEGASVVDVTGGFMIKLQFNQHGALVLDTISSSSKGRRIVVESQFGQARWLAAPLISRRISEGAFIFTPDASREESERIVRGLNNVAAEIRKRARY